MLKQNPDTANTNKTVRRAISLKISAELKTKQATISTGNITAFINYMKHLQKRSLISTGLNEVNHSDAYDNIPHVNQFVEVLTEDQKSETVLRIVEKIFSRAAPTKMVIFSFRSSISHLMKLCQKMMSKNIPIITIPENASDSFKFIVLRDFKFGILLATDECFADTDQKTGW
jgi:superfamily II DNA/RNA helicase